MSDVRRYLSAFWNALRMTARGETIAAPVQAPIEKWINDYRLLVDDLLRTAEQTGMNQTARKQIKLRLDGRSMSFETALMTLRFHATEEYPSLLSRGKGSDVQNTLYATNMNDHYWIIRMLEAPELKNNMIHNALSSLLAHLDTIPKLD